MKDPQVSVIIPVYNAANFVTQAVESAVMLGEVGEVIVVEDGSPDNALEICRELADRYAKVKLFQHPNGENKGPGASRNLGIINASFDFIAFLDADDWYLPNRFKKDMEVFTQHPDADGVYGATGFYYQEKDILDCEKLTTFHKVPSPDQVAFSILTGIQGHFSTNAFTLKRSLIAKTGYFDEELKLHQDTLFWILCAVQGNLYPGETAKAVAVRRVHRNNRILAKNHRSLKHFNQKLFLSLSKIDKIDLKLFRVVFINHINQKSKNKITKLFFAVLEIMKQPLIIFKLF